MPTRPGRPSALFGCIPCALLIAGLALAEDPPSVETRSVDGTGNNVAHPEWGSVGTQLLRLTTVSYADGVDAPAGPDRPGARAVSNAVCAQDELIPNPAGASDFIWQWGQFIDHDTTLVDFAIPIEPFNIPVPLGDPHFDPDGTGTAEIPLDRSAYDPATGTDPSNPREQIEFITAYIDASMVYGSDTRRAEALRTLDGTGRLKTSAGNLLPFNVDGLPNFGGNGPELFLAGDIRANEQIGLTSMHTLWMREHNRLVDGFGSMFPMLTGEELYQLGRAIVGAEIQVITFREFLPLLVGESAIPSYAGYDPAVNASIANAFASVYRVGHTLLSPMLQRMDGDGDAMEPVALRDAFFALHIITDEGGIDPILRGLASQTAQNVDPFVIDEVRNFLFGPPGAGGFDLASLNMQRGRDHGLPSYAQARLDFGLAPVDEFSDISSDPDIVRSLSDVYDRVDDVDLWVGAISEDHMPGAMVGELLQTVIVDQFTRLRDGDRFWYENVFSGPMLQKLERVRLSDVIRANTDIDDEIQDDVFRAVPPCAGDGDDDGEVGLSDLLLVLSEFGGDDEEADVNGDGIVDFDDLLLVLSSWGPCDEW